MIPISVSLQVEQILESVEMQVKDVIVIGSGGGGDFRTQAKEVTPTTERIVVRPDVGYDGLSSVTVYPITIPQNYGRITYNGATLTVS